MSFLVDAKNLEIRSNLKLIGDVHEIKQVFQLIGFDWNDSKISGNRAADNEMKKKYFSFEKSMLTDQTILDICGYIYMDYCFLDFEPPNTCKEFVIKKCKRAQII